MTTFANNCLKNAHFFTETSAIWIYSILWLRRFNSDSVSSGGILLFLFFT
nr:MAG TPA: hypothetical protein [Caudoviricetes sp.]